MTPQWSKLLSREGVDATTMSGADIYFIDSVRKFTRTKQELFFTYFQGKKFSHYIGVDSQALGRSLYKKYFNSPAQIIRYYREGQVLKKRIQRESSRFSSILEHGGTKAERVKAFQEFRKEFLNITKIYNILSYLSIEAWQGDCNTILTRLLDKASLSANEREKILHSVYHPWKKTAIIKIQDDLQKGVSVATLAGRYQFLRSWSVIWYRPIDEAWVKNMAPKMLQEETRSYSFGQLVKILHPNKFEADFLKLAPYIIFFKDWRDDLRRYHAFAWTFLWEALAKKFDCAPFDFGYLTLDEIKACLTNDALPVESIAIRKIQPYVLATQGKKLQIIAHEKISVRQVKIVQALEGQSQTAGTVTGLVAQTGKITGAVLVLNSFHDIKKMEDGRIPLIPIIFPPCNAPPLLLPMKAG